MPNKIKLPAMITSLDSNAWRNRCEEIAIKYVLFSQIAIKYVLLLGYWNARVLTNGFYATEMPK